MNVALVTPEYPPGPSGGIGTGTRNLGRALVAAGHQAQVIVLGEGDDHSDEGVAIRHLSPDHPPRLGWYVVRRDLQRMLRRSVEEDCIEVVESPDWLGLTAGVRPNVPVVVRCHGSAAYFGSILGDRVRPSVKAAEALALHRARSVAAVSHFTAERTRSLFRLRAMPQVVPNSIDVARFASLPLGGEFIILYLGTVVRKKGILDLCAAFNEVVRRVPSARLVVVGRDSPDRRTGASSTWQLGWSALDGPARARAEYLGAVAYDEVHTQLQQARLCAFPSYAEAGPLAWMEAMASGRVIVAFDRPWAHEVVTDRVSGRLVTTGDPRVLGTTLAELLPDDERLSDMGAAARQHAEQQFSLEVGVHNTLRWYQRALD